jgi:hypothetical protein
MGIVLTIIGTLLILFAGFTPICTNASAMHGSSNIVGIGGCFSSWGMAYSELYLGIALVVMGIVIALFSILPWKRRMPKQVAFNGTLHCEPC